jgi:hypothetical protein
VVLLTAGPVAVRVAAAGPAPDSTRLESLRLRCAAVARLRIQTTTGVLMRGRVRLEPGGVLLATAARRPVPPDSFDATAPARTVPWSEVERIDALTSSTQRGFVVGALLGVAATGVAIALVRGLDLFEEGDRGVINLGFRFTVLTGAAGAAIGALRPHRERLYP